MIDALKYAKQICYSSEQTLEFSYEMAKKYADKPGVYIECGVAAGAQIIAMAKGAPNKTIYAFDSFQGIPLPSNRDDQMPGIMMLTESERKALPDPGKQKLETTGATSVSMEHVSAHLTNAGIIEKNIILVKGWFEETTIGFNESISILRLDGDLYNSTYVCLENLFPKILPGGVVIIDDWELKGCKDACIDYFESIGYEPKYKSLSNIVYFYK
jgi:O-methyltransferase